MQFAFLQEPLVYDGTQLRSGFAPDRCEAEGSCVLAWIGPCHVEGENLVDLADRDAGETIVATSMLHVIVEHPGAGIEIITLRQRLLVEAARISVEEQADPPRRLLRKGDDIFDGEAKLSVSVATTSPVSGLIHLGINIDGTGAPVKTLSLTEMGIAPEGFARRLFCRYNDELQMVRTACGKVRPVD